LKGEIVIGKREENKLKHYQETHKIVDGIEYKQCSKCKEFQPMTEKYFYKSNYSNDGFSSQCIKCALAYCKVKNAKPEKKAEQSIRFRKWYLKNKKYKNMQSRLWRVGNLEFWNKYMAEYQKDNREQINKYSRNRREKNHRITDKEWYNCKLYFNFRCAYCGKTWEQNFEETGKDLHKEHSIWDGKDNLSNCVPACQSCNSSKWQYPFNLWYNKYNPVYTYERYHKIYEWLHHDYKKYIQKRKPKGKYTKKAS
jgi:5-methylcytosine-specific restriction endonuclease McrA